MLLNYPDDPDVRVTTDIDALIEPNDEIDEVVAEMAHDLELPRQWLNAAGKSWLRVAGDAAKRSGQRVGCHAEGADRHEARCCA